MTARQSKHDRTALQHEGARIFSAQQAAKRLLRRTQSERSAVVHIPRDELATLAVELDAICAIASRHHLERAMSGSLAPDVFPGPAE